eukprot:TRINITY_DN2217_c1_g1_i1.p1 TRINITY_DN2217_c1_g1~~TRINITY_DN2217_c1_g1_i1.p1  ORF type:complete len:355 (-),score=150.10 TRINITY_DN2217_c1_g1_i1:92-1156(-)
MEDLFNLATFAEAAKPIKRGRGRPRKGEEMGNGSLRLSDSDIESEDAFDEGNSDEDLIIASLASGINSESSSPSSPVASPPAHGSPTGYYYYPSSSAKLYDGMINDSAKRGRGRPRKTRGEEEDYDEDVKKSLTKSSSFSSNSSSSSSNSRARPMKKKKTNGNGEESSKSKGDSWSDDDSDSESSGNFGSSWFSSTEGKGEHSDYTGESPVSSRKKIQSNSLASAKPANSASVSSVRRVPCFYSRCTHSYRRPNSNIVEFSDRPLILTEKYSGYTIRSCKKHHDWWRNAKERGTCEICRGLNDQDNPAKTHTNRANTSFHICNVCALRQCDVLGLPDVDKSLNPIIINNNSPSS